MIIPLNPISLHHHQMFCFPLDILFMTGLQPYFTRCNWCYSGVHIRKTVCSYGHRKHMTLGCIFKEFTNLRRNSRVDRLACNIGNFSPTSFLSWCWLTRHNLRLILRQEIKSERRRLLPRILIILLIHLTDKEHRNPSIRFGFFDSAFAV